MPALRDRDLMINARRQRMRILHAKVHRQSAYAADRLGGINPPLISFKRPSVRSVLVWSFSCHSRLNKTEPRYENRSPAKGVRECNTCHPAKRGGGIFRPLPLFVRLQWHIRFPHLPTLSLYHRKTPREYQTFINIAFVTADSKISSGDHSTYSYCTEYLLVFSDCRNSLPRSSLPT